MHWMAAKSVLNRMGIQNVRDGLIAYIPCNNNNYSTWSA